MKKLFRMGLLASVLMILLAIPALAVSDVDESDTTSNWTYTATLDGNDNEIIETPAATPTTIQAGDMYLLIVIKTSSLGEGGVFPASLSADKILYIDQKTASAEDGANNTIVFADFIPMNYTRGTAFVTGGSLTAPLAIGTLDDHGILGDVNSTNTVNSTDARWILQYYVHLREFTETQRRLGDVNDSGTVNSTDARWVLQRYVGIRDSDYNLVG